MRPKGYVFFENWWIQQGDHVQMPAMPDVAAVGGEAAAVRCDPRKRPTGSLQGWKIHICGFRDAARVHFQATSQPLIDQIVAHEYFPFEEIANLDIGDAEWDHLDDREKSNSCVFYPKDEVQLNAIVTAVNEKIMEVVRTSRAAGAHAQVKPFSGGVIGDINYGQSGFIFCSYN